MPVAIRIRKPIERLAPGLPSRPVRRFTVDEYHRLIQTGILKEDEPVELINGWIVPKMPANPTHSSATRRLDKLLQRMLGDAAVVGVQQPITTIDSEPEPDLTVCSGPENLYFTAHPEPDDIHFVIEVSDSSLTYDRGEKLMLYARAGIKEYWIVNLNERQIEVHSLPRSGRNPKYRSLAEYGVREAVPVAIRGKRFGDISVKDVVPPGG